MEPPGTRSKTPGGVFSRAIRDHPVITAVMVVCIAGGAALGLLGLDPEWSVARRLAGGIVGGAGVGLLITATKMMGQ
jgi:hypothetical protein